MKKHNPILIAWGIVAIALVLLAFVTIYSRQWGYTVPFVSGTILPLLDRHQVWGVTLRGPAVLMRGEDWFFLIAVGLAAGLGILAAIVNHLLRSPPPKPPAASDEDDEEMGGRPRRGRAELRQGPDRYR